MEETLTDCLVRVREDLSQLKKVREYLDTNAETEERCSVTWRTVEAFNSILSVCSSQNTPETNALDTLLDSFYYLARNNTDDGVWDDFGFELGIICVKILSAIERSEIFEILFCKLLSVISIICEHNSNVWKTAARQILNVLINKRLSLSYLEAVVKLYICILKNIDSSALSEFSSQNLHLLKTLSLLVQKVGDFEIQSSVIELVFLHLSNQTRLMLDFFSSTNTKLFQSLQFTDFEDDCRLYLNAVNKRGFERKVFSICCHVLYLGGCFIEPPFGKNCVWVDANKDSERLSMKCGDENGNRVVLVQFSEIVKVQLENGKTEGNPCLTIQTKNMTVLHKDARNDDICLITDKAEEVSEFVRFLETIIGGRKRKKRLGMRESKTMDCLVINRNSPKLEVQDNRITSSERPGIDQVLPDVFTLFENANPATEKVKTPPRTTSQQQQLSPNSFVESLNKHIGLESPELRHTYEDSVETIQFPHKSTPSHKLFRSPDKIFDILDKTEPEFNFNFGENKENMPKPKIKTYSRKPGKPETPRILQERKNIENKIPNIETEISNIESQDYFRTDQSVLNKKPCLPKIKRNPKPIRTLKKQENKLNTTKNTLRNKQVEWKAEFLENEDDDLPNPKQPETENSKEKSKCIHTRRQVRQKHSVNQFRLELTIKEKQESTTKPETENSKGMSKNTQNKQPEQRNRKENSFERHKESTELQEKEKPNTKPDCLKKQSKPETEITKRQTTKPNAKPSLLDPNGYAYQRWCRPTTSERSNFWLNKLNAMQKPSKIDSDSVFDFSEDTSDSTSGKQKIKKRVVRSKPKSRPKQTSLRQVKEILKKSPPKGKPKVCPREKETTVPTVPSPSAPPEPIIDAVEQGHLSDISKESSSPYSINQPPADSEYESMSEDEPPAATKKCEVSDSSSKKCLKKKTKVVLPKNILLTLRRRLVKAEEKDRQQTNEVIKTVDKATNHLFNHLQRKDGGRVVSYLNAAETASGAIEGEIDELNLRVKRIQRAILYYKAGCSVADFYESLGEKLSKVRDAMKEFKGTKDSSKTIDRVHVRLGDLIKSEIGKAIGDEWTNKRNRLLKCATILGVDFREFG